MDPAAAALRATWTRERSWTCNRVQAAICTAWGAHPRTVEHTVIMQWPSMLLPLDYDARMACHMMGLNCQNPSAYPLRRLVRERLGWSWNKYTRARDRACEAIAAKLNGGLYDDIAEAA